MKRYCDVEHSHNKRCEGCASGVEDVAGAVVERGDVLVCVPETAPAGAYVLTLVCVPVRAVSCVSRPWRGGEDGPGGLLLPGHVFSIAHSVADRPPLC